MDSLLYMNWNKAISRDIEKSAAKLNPFALFNSVKILLTRNISSWFIRRLSTSATDHWASIYLQLLSYRTLLEEENKATFDKKDFDNFNAVFKTIRAIYFRYESIQYMDNKNLQKIMEDCLELAYRIDSSLRKLAKPNSAMDKETEISEMLSKHNLQSLFKPE